MVYGGSDIISSDSVQGGILFYLISRQAGMQRLFRGKNIFLDCTQTVRSGRFLSRNKMGVRSIIYYLIISRQAGMDGFFRVENALWTVRRRYVQGGILFSFIISQKAIPDFVLSWDK